MDNNNHYLGYMRGNYFQRFDYEDGKTPMRLNSDFDPYEYDFGPYDRIRYKQDHEGNEYADVEP